MIPRRFSCALTALALAAASSSRAAEDQGLHAAKDGRLVDPDGWMNDDSDANVRPEESEATPVPKVAPPPTRDDESSPEEEDESSQDGEDPSREEEQDVPLYDGEEPSYDDEDPSYDDEPTSEPWSVPRSTARVRFRSNQPGAVLEIRQTQFERGLTANNENMDSSWRPVCVAPCKADLPHMATYRIRGEDIWTSDTFKLPLTKSEFFVSADAGSKSARIVGIVLTSVGGALTLAGHQVVEKNTGGVEAAGKVVLGGGVVMLLVGIVLTVSNGTDVSVVGRRGSARVPIVESFSWTPNGFVF